MTLSSVQFTGCCYPTVWLLYEATLSVLRVEITIAID